MLTVGVTTCMRGDDHPYFQSTLRSIREAGFFIDVLQGDGDCEPLTSFAASFGVEAVCGRYGPLLGPKPTFKKCVYQLLQSQRENVLIFQDDINVAKGCCDWLMQDIPDGIWSLYCATPLDRHDGWRRLDLTPREGDRFPWQNSLGACAIGMDRSTAELWLQHDPEFRNAACIGASLGRFCHLREIPFSVHAPSLVHHTGAISCCGTRTLTPDRMEARFCEDVRFL